MGRSKEQFQEERQSVENYLYQKVNLKHMVAIKSGTLFYCYGREYFIIQLEKQCQVELTDKRTKEKYIFEALWYDIAEDGSYSYISTEAVFRYITKHLKP